MDIVSLLPQFGGLIWTIVAFVVALSVIVAIHEYGHYIVGRWSGIHADVFSIGFGPVLWSRHDKRGTRWQIAALPFGGYVKFAGDSNAASGKDEDAMEEAARDPVAYRRTMHGAPLWARTATVAAGPVFNFIMSILVFAAVAMTAGQDREPLTVGELTPLPSQTRGLEPGDVIVEVAGLEIPRKDDPAYGEFLDAIPVEPVLPFVVERDGTQVELTDPYILPPVIAGLSAKSAAMAAELEIGDVITAIDGTPVFAFSQLKNAVEGSDGATLDLTVWRDGQEIAVSLSPKRIDEPLDEGGFQTQWRIGVASGYSFTPARETLGPGAALLRGVDRTGEIITGSLSGLWHMIAGNIGTCNLSGPVGIAQVSGQMASQGFLSFVVFIAVLSTAVGLLNLFPIPALDGGHLVFYAYEAVMGRPPSDAALRVLMTIGLTLVLSLMVFALYNDFRCP
ncbi:RIP metalloprotease RseP [Aliishimia ponticola]|uniref:Zinc metalloprotease n=1 Tax=Aliishimia ponticola TaxID=2499833 RepID=A0A4S4NI59_9RHOB|nr:RIP metalloprotease RseP [Aliishimia ponticola]THH38387.1 RIP metalloprotease RseP [Aliishimia ponticola]